MILVDPQNPLPGFGMTLLDCSHNELGERGELTAKILFRKAGYYVEKASERCGDLRVTCTSTGQTWRVEVKTARRAKDYKWRFTLWKEGHTDHRYSDIVLLLAVTATGDVVPFVVPIAVLKDQNQAVISSEPHYYAGKLAAYRQLDTLALA